MREAAAMAIAMMVLALAGGHGGEEARVPASFAGEAPSITWLLVTT